MEERKFTLRLPFCSFHYLKLSGGCARRDEAADIIYHERVSLGELRSQSRCQMRANGASKQFYKFVNGHAGLFDDGGERSSLQVFIVVWD